MLDTELAREVAGQVSVTVWIASSDKNVALRCECYTGKSLAPTATVRATSDTNLE